MGTESWDRRATRKTTSDNEIPGIMQYCATQVFRITSTGLEVMTGDRLIAGAFVLHRALVWSQVIRTVQEYWHYRDPNALAKVPGSPRQYISRGDVVTAGLPNCRMLDRLWPF